MSQTASPAEVGALAAQMAREAAAHPETHVLALGALAPHWPPPGPVPDSQEPDGGARFVAALGRWAKAQRFVREPIGVGEVVCAPWRTVLYGAGDCDDLACAVAAFAAVVGLPSAIAILRGPDASAHAVALVGDSWSREPSNRGRITHIIDHSGAQRVTPATSLATLEVFAVHRGE